MTPTDVDTLVEAWVNGNRAWMLDQVLGLTKPEAVLVALRIACCLSASDVHVLCRMLDVRAALPRRRGAVRSGSAGMREERM